MNKYGDYFSRKELFYLGVNPEKELEILKDFSEENKYEKIATNMKAIYEFLKESNNPNLRGKALETKEEILNNKAQRRIVAAFYDLGILEEKDLNRFPLDYNINSFKSIEKESINVLEALDEVEEVSEGRVFEANTKEKLL